MIIVCTILTLCFGGFALRTVESASASTKKPERKVAFVCASGSKGGTEQLVRQYAREFRNRGYDATIIATHPENFEWLSEFGVPTVLAQIGTKGRYFSIFKLAKALRPYRNGVVNIHYPTFDVHRLHLAAARLAGCQNVCLSLHHPTFENSSRTASTRTMLEDVSKVIFTTQENLDIARQIGLLGSSKAEVRLPGVIPGALTPQHEARTALNIPTDKIVISTMCRLAPEKRVHLLVEAIARCPQKDRLHLAIGGSGPERESIAKVARESLGDQFTMLGFMGDPSMLYAASDVYAMLSDLEGFGLAFVEAAAHGLPSLGCSGGGVTNAIKDNVTGYIVPNNDPVPQSAEHLAKWVDDGELRTTMGAAARQFYEDNYTFEAASDRYEQALFDSNE